MGKHTDQRDRTLCLARILYEETDEKHPMPMTEMIRRLEEEGVASERKSIYRDLAAMNKQGFEVAYRHGKTGGWYLAGRPLNLSELQTVIDAVAVYRWIPAALRASLLDKLAGLFPRGQRGQLRRIAGHHMQPRVVRQQRRPRAARVGDRVNRHALRQQLCTQRHPDCPRRTGDDGGVDLSLNACHF